MVVWMMNMVLARLVVMMIVVKRVVNVVVKVVVKVLVVRVLVSALDTVILILHPPIELKLLIKKSLRYQIASSIKFLIDNWYSVMF